MNFVAARTFNVEVLDSGIHEHYGGRQKKGMWWDCGAEYDNGGIPLFRFGNRRHFGIH